MILALNSCTSTRTIRWFILYILVVCADRGTWERARAGGWALGVRLGAAWLPTSEDASLDGQRETRSFRDQTWCISRDQVREQLRYHHNDFLGRANAHHLAVRHSGPSPSKGPARRAPRFLLEFSRRPFTGPRLARPCARDKQGQRQTRARWSGAPAASLSVSLMSHTCSESERCLFASRTCTRRTKYYGPAASLPGELSI